MKESGIKTVVTNRKAFHEYEIGDKWEAGIVLSGTEVKSIRSGKVNLTDGWVDFDDHNEAWLREVHISPWTHGNVWNHAEKRPRKLLLKRSEIIKLTHLVATKGMALIPIRFYFKGQRVKVEIALGKGKKHHDKRESAKEKDANREIERAMRTSRKRDSE